MNNPDRQLIAKETGHGGVISSDQAIKKISKWTEKWVAS
jgi:hypothetical protein